MKALLYKDLVSGKSTYLLALVIVLVIAAYLTFNEAMVIIPFLFAFMPMVLNTISFSKETKSDFAKFAFTTPITRKDYVKSKYSVAILFGMVALLSGCILGCLECVSLNLALIIGMVSFALPIIISSIQIPFILKFDEGKGGIVIVAINLLIFASARFIGDSLGGLINLIQTISKLNIYLIVGIICVITILILTISQNIGVVIMKRKEF